MTKRRIVGFLAVLSLLAISAVFYARTFDESLISHLSIGGIDVSGLAVSEAESELLNNPYPVLSERVEVALNGRDYSFSYGQLGADIDVYRTLEKAYAYGHSGNAVADFATRIASLVKPTEISPVLYTDADYARSVVAERTGVSDVDVVALLDAAQEQNDLSASLYASVVSSELFRKKVVTLGEATPDFKPDPVEHFPVKSVKIIVDNDFTPYQSWEIFFDNEAWFDVSEGEDGAVTAQLSEDKISEFLAKNIIPKVEREPKNLIIRSVPEDAVGYAQVEGALEHGIKMPLEVNVKRIMTFVPQRVPRIYLATLKIEAEIINETEKDLGALEAIGEGRSNFRTSPEGRAFNVRKGISEHVNNLVMAPGATYSFNKQLGGPVTNAGGWKDSLAIFGGTTLRPVPGGGLCQVSTTNYRAFLNAGLKIAKRYPHSLYVHYYTPYGEGLDATVYPGQAGGKDLQMVNDTPGYIFVQAYTSGDDAFVKIYGTPDGRKVVLNGPYRNNEVPAEFSTKQYSPRSIVWFQDITWPDGRFERNEILSTYVKSLPKKGTAYYQNISRED